MVVIDGENQIIGSHIERSGAVLTNSIESTLEGVLAGSGLLRNRIKHITATGFGRRNVKFADSIKTEISCHARGAYYNFSKAITLIDIGGQDTKIIKISNDGKLLNFRMNRKCAAGTGSFLEEIALRMNIPVMEMNDLAVGSDNTSALGSFCTVFASSEILTRIRNGERIEDMARSAFESVARRVIEMDVFHGTIVMSGGVVKYNNVIVDILERHLGKTISVTPHPQLTGAFGAALYASEYEIL
jgi:predicted CoA-substrate-specific enzyme activase